MKNRKKRTPTDMALIRQQEATWIFAYNVKDILTSKLQGNVYFYLEDDTLIFKVESTTGITFTYNIPTLSQRIVHGLSSETVAQTIVKMYTNYIIKLHFK